VQDAQPALVYDEQTEVDGQELTAEYLPFVEGQAADLTTQVPPLDTVEGGWHHAQELSKAQVVQLVYALHCCAAAHATHAASRSAREDSMPLGICAYV
jgi:hypothetical protein